MLYTNDINQTSQLIQNTIGTIPCIIWSNLSQNFDLSHGLKVPSLAI